MVLTAGSSPAVANAIGGAMWRWFGDGDGLDLDALVTKPERRVCTRWGLRPHLN